MYGIERRAKRNLFSFTFIDKHKYVSLEHYKPATTDFAQKVRKSLTGKWLDEYVMGIWHHYIPADRGTPDQGFKVHVSATFENASEILSAVVPILSRERVAFKFLADVRILDFINSQGMPRSACGKFMTIYPRSLDQFKTLIETLHEATRKFSGPYILSDKRYPDSKVLFYRYGAFRSLSRLNVFGEREQYLRDKDGQLTPDERRAFFHLPEGIDDPFGSNDAIISEPVLNGRYRAKSVLSSSSKGGVYLCLDEATGQDVVVKEARPLVNFTSANPYDAVACLRHEYEVLQRLQSTGYTPRPIAFFTEWEHAFLVMEKVAGVPLSSYRAHENFSIMLKTDYSDQDLRGYCEEFLSITEKLLNAVRAIHECGVIIMDLAPQNVLVTPGEGKVSIIDFESAFYSDDGQDSPIIDIGTIGYSRERGALGRRPERADDYRALSNVLCDLLFPVGLMFAHNKGAKAAFIAHVRAIKGLPHEIAELISHIGDRSDDAPKMLVAAKSAAAHAVRPASTGSRIPKEHLDGAVAQITFYIDSQLRSGDETGLLPTDYRRYATNPLGLAYGYSGIAQFMHEATGQVPTRLRDEIVRLSDVMTVEEYPPGLYVGMAGVAWVLENIGEREAAVRTLALSAESPLLFDNADLFYGAAGWGLSNLFFHRATSDGKYIEAAQRAAEWITPRLELAPTGLYYRNFDDTVYYGYGHGAAGIALFFIKLYEASGEAVYIDIACRLLDYEIAIADTRDGHLVWQRSSRDSVKSPYLRVGNAGITGVLLRLYSVTRSQKYLDAARKSAAYLFGKLSVFPGLLSGTAGLGEMFIDMYHATGEERYLDEAHGFAERTLLFRVDRADGVVFPGDELVRLSTDLATGSAGVGLFLHRLARGGTRTFHDF